MLTLIALTWLAACTDGTTTEDSGLDPDVFAATISSHADGDKVLEGYRVGLAGWVNDPDGVDSDLAVTWTVDGVEECPETTADAEGGTSCDFVFVPGEPVVVLEMRAPDGETAQATVTLEVIPTEPPTAVITEPIDGSVVSNDPGVYLLGTVSDAEDGPAALLATWSSDVQGPLVGVSEPSADGISEAQVVLDPGDHVLTLSVIDVTGKSGSDSVTVTVQ
jgi:hypothetical protein